MKRSPLEHVKHLIKKLSAEDKQKIVPFLAQLPETGVQSYDLRQEIEYLKKHGHRIAGPGGDDHAYLVNLVFVRNLVAAQVLDTNVLVAAFLPDNFVEAFPRLKQQVDIHTENFYKLFTEEKRAERRAVLEAQGIPQTEEEFEAEIRKNCETAATLWVTEKGKRIAEQISLHLPGMVGDMMVAAIKGQMFYDFYQEFRELKPDETPPSLKEFKKLAQDSAWREIKPHLPSTKHVRTHPDWRGEDTRKRFAQKVNDRKALATSIKDKYEECDFEAGWTEDLKEDATYARLSSDVPQAVIDFAIRRVASEATERERQPLSVALEMARLELNLQEQDIETLHKYYADGLRLLKADRSRPPSSI